LGVLGNCKSNMKDDDVPGVGAWNSRQVLILRVGRFLSSVRPIFHSKLPRQKKRKEKKKKSKVLSLIIVKYLSFIRFGIVLAWWMINAR
jgi:hypothetical protein